MKQALDEEVRRAAKEINDHLRVLADKALETNSTQVYNVSLYDMPMTFVVMPERDPETGVMVAKIYQLNAPPPTLFGRPL